MLFQLFHIRKTIRDAKEARDNPQGFATSQLKESALGLIIPPFVFAFLLVALFFVFGYIVGDGSGFFKVLFWIFFIPFLLVSYFIYTIRRAMLRLQKKKGTPTETIYAKVTEVKKPE